MSCKLSNLNKDRANELATQELASDVFSSSSNTPQYHAALVLQRRLGMQVVTLARSTKRDVEEHPLADAAHLDMGRNKG